jgi:hypothetical protein
MPLRHHSLVAWQRADDLFIGLHQLSLKSFPAFERYELEIRRVGAPLNGLVCAAHLLPILSVVAGAALGVLMMTLL